jgi:hypothetical protein
MCHGKTKKELCEDFDRRTREREFPTCPPRMLDDDLRLTFVNPKDGIRYFHHGGQFALTRWTNLYFPNSQLLWGDAIGGEVGSVFTSMSKRDEFFAHVLYWDMKHGKDAPHIEALRMAIDLADTGLANSL